MPLRSRSPLLWTVAAFTLAALVWAAVPDRIASPELAADLPAGALMTVESPDFSALLHSWTHSPEQRAWLNSADYSAFANSRLFSRLADAQSGFANAAKTPLDTSFLQQVAGKESIFAWYDIGNLEFLYITHLTHEQIAGISLLQQRSSFARRESAGTPFYVRTEIAPADATSAENTGAAAPPAADAANPASPQDLNQPRTVAFALRGDWLLLATREDLIANALQLMASPGAGNTGTESQANVGWFSAATAAGPAQHGDLHMLLDLQTLTKTPQFRTYWIQRNVTETRGYRAAVVDLYREPDRFREERVLLPMEPPTSSDQADLGELEALAPQDTGIYRAVAQPTAALVLSTLDEKLLNSSTSLARSSGQAPAPEASVPLSGTPNDLDIRIDAPRVTPETPDEALAPLRHILDVAHIQSMLTLDRSEVVDANLPFVHIHSAMVLRAAVPWNKQLLTDALTAALRPRLTTASLGLGWQQASSPNGSYFYLSGAQPLVLHIDGQLAVLSNDSTLLSEILTSPQQHSPSQPAQFIAGIHPAQERANFRRLTAQLAGASAASEAAPSGTSVQLFRDNLPSLAESFSAVASEHIIVRNDGPLVRQSVIYQWTRSPASPR